jgi:hypothetical protein
MPDQMKVAFTLDEIRVKNKNTSIMIMIETIGKKPLNLKLYFHSHDIENNCHILSDFLTYLKKNGYISQEKTTIYTSGRLGIISFMKILLEQKPKRIFYEKESLKNIPEGEKFRLDKIASKLAIPVIGVN